jgi:chondroitin synthase
MPSVSIFIPAYNSSEFIGQTLLSALKQTFQDIEICVCDDGSTDDTLTIIRAFQKKYNKLYGYDVIKCKPHAKNQGEAASYQTAMSICSGKYLCHLDSDDVLAPTAVAELKNLLDQHQDVGLVFSTFSTIDGHGRLVEKEPPWYPSVVGDSNIKAHLFTRGMCVSPCRMFRRQLMEQAGGIPPSPQYAADYAISLRIAEQAKLLRHPKSLYLYRLHGTNTISKKLKLVQNAAHLIKAQSARRRLKQLQNTTKENK